MHAIPEGKNDIVVIVPIGLEYKVRHLVSDEEHSIAMSVGPLTVHTL